MHWIAVLIAILPPAGSDAPARSSVKSLIRKMGDGDYYTREAAQQALLGIGESALPTLRKSVNSPDPEIRYRTRGVIRSIMIAAGKSPSTGMKLSLMDPGDFLMGSPPRESGRRPDEKQHRVQISTPFLMGSYEVTQEEFRKVMKASPSWFGPKGGGAAKVKGVDTSRFPVDNVSWFDAIAFCNALSKLDRYPAYYKISEIKREAGSIVSARVSIVGGNGYRLPTEAEWEFSCRAGSTTAFHFGNGSNGKLANVKGVTYTGYGGRVKGPNLKRTTKVGSYKPNWRGLYDMHGNVAEWCWDWYAREYGGGIVTSDPRGPKTGHHRVLRGGSWLVTEASTRSASRLFHTPMESKFYTGFRVARTP